MSKEKQMAAVDVAALQADAEEQATNQAARFDLSDLVKKGEELEELRKKLDVASKIVSSLSEEIRVLETETLPDMLMALKLKDLTLASGAKISLFDVIGATITDENREDAHTWLRENGHGDIIKNNVTLTFGKGEDHAATLLIKHLLDLRKNGATKFGDLVQKEAVHPQTLKAFTKEQLASGKPFPGELFKLYTGQAVKITK
jgi:hypothetical protein